MAKRIDKPVRARHIEIFEEDWEFLTMNFGRRGPVKFGAGNMIRVIVHKHVMAMRNRQVEKLDEVAPATANTLEAIMDRVEESRRAATPSDVLVDE